MKLCIFGSRSITNTELVSKYIALAIEAVRATELLTALEPAGVCEIARGYATTNKFPITTVPKQKEHAQGQYHWRSVKCYELADFALIIHDGASKGTKNEFDLALKMGLPVIYITVTTKNGSVQQVEDWSDVPGFEFWKNDE